MNEKQAREKLSKLKDQRDDIDTQIVELEEELPERVSTRGDPVVEFH